MVTNRVLVVDDDPTVSEVVSLYLEREGYEVEVVSDGLVAVERATADPPDLVVLDLMLPGIDGLEDRPIVLNPRCRLESKNLDIENAHTELGNAPYGFPNHRRVTHHRMAASGHMHT